MSVQAVPGVQQNGNAHVTFADVVQARHEDESRFRILLGLFERSRHPVPVRRGVESDLDILGCQPLACALHRPLEVVVERDDHDPGRGLNR